MFGFSKHGPDGRYGVICDVTSGSVNISIVASDPEAKFPNTIWSHTEHARVQKDSVKPITKKEATTMILNAFLELGAGITALREYDPAAELSATHILISAPWSYTATKTVCYQSENPFVITKTLIEELSEKAEKSVFEAMKENDLSKEFDLAVLNQVTMEITANGYRVKDPVEKEARKVTLEHLLGVTDKHILAALQEAHEKVVPKTTFCTSTSMFAYYQAHQHLSSSTSEACLVTITGEATEIGIVRDGVLTFNSFIPTGTAALAREIALATKAPYAESMGYLRSGANLSDTKQAELTHIQNDYEGALHNLFTQTGDLLAIPTSIFLNVEPGTETFFIDRITATLQESAGSKHAIHALSPEFFADDFATNTNSALAAYVFHKKLRNTGYFSA